MTTAGTIWNLAAAVECDTSDLFIVNGNVGGVVRHRDGCDGTSCEPRRIRTVNGDDGWYRVDHSGFLTSDVALAVAVAAELDRVDPLRGYPCECDWCESLDRDAVIIP